MAARQRFEKNISLRFVLSSCLCLAVDAEREEEIRRERRRGRERVKKGNDTRKIKSKAFPANIQFNG